MSGRSGGDSDAPVDDRSEDASTGGDDSVDSDALEIVDILESLAADPTGFDPPVETDAANESDAPDEAETDAAAETGTAEGTASEPDATEPDTASQPAGPTCPHCGARLVATTATGPDTLYGSPCGCRLARGDLEFEFE